jgi:hypothetical protein
MARTMPYKVKRTKQEKRPNRIKWLNTSSQRAPQARGIKKAQNTILQIYKKVIKNPLTSDGCYGIIPLSPKRRVNDF